MKKPKKTTYTHAGRLVFIYVFLFLLTACKSRPTIIMHQQTEPIQPNLHSASIQNYQDSADLSQEIPAFSKLHSYCEWITDEMILPLQTNYGSTPTIQVKIHDKTYRFLLDTGAGLSVISSSLAEQLAIHPIDSNGLSAFTATGSVQTSPAVIPELKAGPVIFYNQPALIIDSAQLEFRLFEIITLYKIDGILGCRFWPAWISKLTRETKN